MAGTWAGVQASSDFQAGLCPALQAACQGRGLQAWQVESSAQTGWASLCSRRARAFLQPSPSLGTPTPALCRPVHSCLHPSHIHSVPPLSLAFGLQLSPSFLQLMKCSIPRVTSSEVTSSGAISKPSTLKQISQPFLSSLPSVSPGWTARSLSAGQNLVYSPMNLSLLSLLCCSSTHQTVMNSSVINVFPPNSVCPVVPTQLVLNKQWPCDEDPPGTSMCQFRGSAGCLSRAVGSKG